MGATRLVAICVWRRPGSLLSTCIDNVGVNCAGGAGWHVSCKSVWKVTGTDRAGMQLGIWAASCKDIQAVATGKRVWRERTEYQKGARASKQCENRQGRKKMARGSFRIRNACRDCGLIVKAETGGVLDQIEKKMVRSQRKGPQVE